VPAIRARVAELRRRFSGVQVIVGLDRLDISKVWW